MVNWVSTGRGDSHTNARGRSPHLTPPPRQRQPGRFDAVAVAPMRGPRVLASRPTSPKAVLAS